MSKFLRPLFSRGPVLKRLVSAIELVREEYERTRDRGDLGQPDFQQRLDSAKRFLDSATSAADSNDVNQGWVSLNGARQELIRLRSKPELLLMAKELAEECSEKLKKGWRGATTYALVGEIDPKKPPDDLAERVASAQRVLDGHNDNRYFVEYYRRFQTRLLTWHLLAAIAVILLVSFSSRLIPNADEWYDPSHAVKTGRLSSLITEVDTLLKAGLEEGEGAEEEGNDDELETGESEEVEDSEAREPSDPEEAASRANADDKATADELEYEPANHVHLLVAVLLFGWLGGSFSALTSIAAATGDRKIPEETLDSIVTVMRPFMGAGGAFIIYLTLLAGFPVSGVISSPSVLVFAVAAGFSERFAVRVVERVSASDS